MGTPAIAPPPVQGVPPGLMAEPLPQQNAVRGVPPGLVSEPIKPQVQPPAQPQAPPQVRGVPAGLVAEPIQPDVKVTSAPAQPPSKPPIATTGIPRPGQDHTDPAVIQQQAEQGRAEGWLPQRHAPRSMTPAGLPATQEIPQAFTGASATGSEPTNLQSLHNILEDPLGMRDKPPTPQLPQSGERDGGTGPAPPNVLGFVPQNQPKPKNALEEVQQLQAPRHLVAAPVPGTFATTTPGAIYGQQTPEQAAAAPPTEMHPESRQQALDDVPGLPAGRKIAAEGIGPKPKNVLGDWSIGENTPILPKLHEIDDWWENHTGGGQALAEHKAALAAYDKDHPYQAKVNEALQEFLNNNSTPENVALLAAAPESKVITGLFGAQAAMGSYKSAEAAYEAHLRGDNPEAVKLATEAGLTGLMALGAAAHLADVRTYTGAYGEKGVRAGGPNLGVEVGRTEAYRQPGPTGSYAAEQSTVVPARTTARVNVAGRQFGGEPTPAPVAVPRETAELTANAGERPPVQASNRPEEIRTSAAEQEPALKEMAERAVAGVPGAAVEGSRVKDTDSQANKADRGKPAETNIDNLGARISAETPEARAQVAKNIEAQLPVTGREKITSNGLDADQYAVQTGKPGDANQVSEIQVVPKSQVAAMKETEPLYEQQKQALANGDKAEADRLGAQIEQVHKDALTEAQPAPTGDRRADSATRKRIDQMTPEEMRRTLLTSDKTELPNRRAFDEAEQQRPAPAVAMSDADGLKALNDKFGYAAGDELLRAKAEALREAGLDAYHEKGDEFLYRADTPEELTRKLEKAREILRGRVIEVKTKDGATRRFKGADFSYGGGQDLAQAEEALKQHKSQREARGERARGELRGIAEVGSEPGGKPESAAGVQAGPRLEGVDGKATDLLTPNGKQPAKYRVVPGSPARSPERPAGRIAEGDVVRLSDGRAGVVQYYQTPVNGMGERARVRLASGEIVNSVKPQDLERVSPKPIDPNSPWVGVDLDGTLAHYDGFKGPESIGKPVPEMVERVKRLLAEGKDVRIFSARIANDPKGLTRSAIEAWSQQYLGEALPITNVKDDKMTQMYDDRAVQVERNTGKIVGGEQAEAQAAAKPGGADNAGSAIEGKAAAEKTETGVSPGAEGRHTPQTGQRDIEGKAPERRPGESANDLQTRLLARGRYKRELSAAESRDRDDNFARAQTEKAELYGSPALTVSADAFHALSKFLTDGQDWQAGTLDAGTAKRWVARLRSLESRLRQTPGMKDAAEGARRLALAIDAAGDKDGTVVLMRGDADEDAKREEAAHRWQTANGLRSSAGLEELGAQPQYDKYRRDLEKLGYQLDPEEFATEMVAKALAGEPGVEWIEGDRNSLVTDALKIAVDEKGSGVLDSLPPYDPAVEEAVQQAREYAKEQNAGDRKTADRGLDRAREAKAPADRGKQGGSFLRAARGEPAGAGDQLGDRTGKEEKAELAHENAPTFYLKSAKLIDQKMRGPMPGDALVRMLENNGIKPDELKWTGLDEFRGKGIARPDEVRRVLAANDLQLKEVHKGPDEKRLDDLREMETLSAAQEREFQRLVIERQEDDPRLRYASYQLPGGDNYREMLMTLPGRTAMEDVRIARRARAALDEEGREWNPDEHDQARIDEHIAKQKIQQKDFLSAHWNEPNVLGHVRFNDRTGPSGEKLLHIEELQSDWHQKGRSEGYRGEDKTLNDAKKFFGIADDAWTKMPEADKQAFLDEMNSQEPHVRQGKRAMVPDAPFKKTWPELLLKRMVRYAAENGYDGVSWTPGAQQAERYDLSKQIDRVTYDPKTNRLTAELPNGVRHIDKAVQPGELADYIGKEGAQKLLGRPVDRGLQVLENPDLKVGGEGMKGFYDKIVPDVANKIGKPFGAKVAETQIAQGRGSASSKSMDDYLREHFDTDWLNATAAQRREASDAEIQRIQKASVSVPYLPVTDAMRKGVLEEGQPLFKQNAPAKPETTATTVSRDTGKSLEDTIDALGKMSKGRMTMADHIENAVDRGLGEIGNTGAALQKAWAGLRGAAAAAYSSWSSPAPWTDFTQSLGDLRSAEFKTAMELDRYQKELKRVAPKERDREAMSVYAEARTETQLKRWASDARQAAKTRKDSPFSRYAQAFEDALKLTPEQKQVADTHREYYDQQLKILTDAGLLPAGASHYAMHMFAGDPEALAKAQAATDLSELAPDPSFLKRRVYKSYFDAMMHGETPKTLDAGKILSAYHDAFTKTFMTRSFLRSLLYGVDDGDSRPLAALESRAGWVHVDNDLTGKAQILKQPKRPDDLTGYVRLPASQVKNFKWELSDDDKEMLAPGYKSMPKDEQAKLFGPDDPRFPVPEGKLLALKGDILIHPKYAGRVGDLILRSWLDSGGDLSPVKAGIKGIQKAGTFAKSGILYGSGFHQVQLGVHAMEHLVNPLKLRSLEDLAKDPRVLEGVRHGLNLLNVDPEGVLSELPGMATYHRYLFRDFIPRLKAEMYLRALDRNLHRYGGAKPGKSAQLTQDETHLITAMQANAAFGGLDPAFFRHLNRMNNRTYKALEHMVLFSPDFTKARGQFVIQGAGKFGGEQRIALLRGALALYGLVRIVNLVINRDKGLKGAMWQPQDALNVVTPDSWGPMGGKRIGLRTVQGDMMLLIQDPKTWFYNRLSPVTLRPTIEFLTGRDNFGRQESKEHFFKDYAKQLTPIPVQKLFTTSDEGWISSLFTSAGLETGNYRTPLEAEAHRLRLQGIPDKPESEDKEDENRRNVQATIKLRQGRMSSTDLWNLVNAGKMSAREAAAIQKRASMTELQYDVEHLQDMDDVLAIWRKADAQEKDELRDIVEQKSQRALQNTAEEKGDDAADALEAKLKKEGIDLE